VMRTFPFGIRFVTPRSIARSTAGPEDGVGAASELALPTARHARNDATAIDLTAGEPNG